MLSPLIQEVVPAARFACTDAGNAELFAHLFGESVSFDHKRGRWLIWDGGCWSEDKTERVYQLAKQAARRRHTDSVHLSDIQERQAECSWAIKSEAHARLDAAISLARSEPAISDEGEGWDSNANLLGVLNGVVDLKTGEFRPARREDKITRVAPVAFDPAATCPTFEAFLARIQPDLEVRKYLQRRSGYALTGHVSEQDVAVFWGGGSNGKTTFTNALTDVMGPDYSLQAAPGLLLRKRYESHPTELADLEGARLVISSEIDEGGALAEGLIKQLTGGERIRARRMRQDFYEFDPTHKIILLANHKPIITGTDWGMWRRVKLVPFAETIGPDETDPHLAQKLRHEASGILNWMVAGCLEWQWAGLQEPASVTAATTEYKEESDPLSQFMADQCVTGPGYSIGATALYFDYQNWAREQGFGPKDTMTSTAFGRRMGQRFRREQGRKNNIYHGITLASTQPAPPAVEGFLTVS